MSVTLNSGSIVYSIENKDIFKSGMFTQGINSSGLQDLFSSPPGSDLVYGHIVFVDSGKKLVIVDTRDLVTFSTVDLNTGVVVKSNTLSNATSSVSSFKNSTFLKKIYFKEGGFDNYFEYDWQTNVASYSSTRPAYVADTSGYSYVYKEHVYYVVSGVLRRMHLSTYNVETFSGTGVDAILSIDLKGYLLTSAKRLVGLDTVLFIDFRPMTSLSTVEKSIQGTKAQANIFTGKEIDCEPIVLGDSAFLAIATSGYDTSLYRINGISSPTPSFSVVGQTGANVIKRGSYLFKPAGALEGGRSLTKLSYLKLTTDTTSVTSASFTTMQNTTAGNFNIHPDLNLKPFKVKIVVPGVGPVPDRGVVIKDPNSGETIGEGETDENGETEIDIQYPTVPDGSGGQTPVPPIVVVPPKPGDDPDNPPIPVVVPDPSDPDPIYGYYLHGCVVDKNDVPVSRVVLVISRETDKIVATGLSDAANNGEFTIPMMNNKQVIVMVKGTGGEVAKLYDYVVPLEIE